MGRPVRHQAYRTVRLLEAGTPDPEALDARPVIPPSPGGPPVRSTGGAKTMIAGWGGFMLRPGAQPGTNSNSSRSSAWSPLVWVILESRRLQPRRIALRH